MKMWTTLRFSPTYPHSHSLDYDFSPLHRQPVGAHYVSDVVAGIGMGIVGFSFTVLFANMILKKSRSRQASAVAKSMGCFVGTLHDVIHIDIEIL
jgi:hypothetical protein